MKKIFMAGLALALSPMANAELVKTHWLEDGDNLSMLDTLTGKEFLSFTQTRDYNIDSIQSELDGKFSGWRIANYDEIKTLLSNYITTFDFDRSISYSENYNFGSEAQENMLLLRNMIGISSTFDGHYASGIHYDQDGLATVSGVSNWYGGDLGFDIGQGEHYTSVWLISDGGTTYSSIQDPTINVPQNLSSVPVPLTAGILGLTLLGLRRKSK